MKAADVVLVVALTALGLVARGLGPLSSSFPLNDGGLFYQMILDLRETLPLLPRTATYNDLEIPFAYPPLAFYVGAILHEPLGGDVEVMRLVPLVASTLTVPAFFLLARSLSTGRTATALATVAFALMPRAFEWLIMGGGLTRSIGLLLAILALWSTVRMLRQPAAGSAGLAGVLGGLTMLAHPQAGLFTLLSGLVLVAAMVRSRRAAFHVLLSVGAAGLIVAPWLLTVVLTHGIGPLLSASGSQPGAWIGFLSLLQFEVSGSRLFNVIGLLAAAGALVSIVRGRYLLPIWLGVAVIFDSRGGETYATVPAALLAGQAMMDLVLAPLWREHAEGRPRRPSAFALTAPIPTAVLIVAGTVALVDALGSQLAPTWPAVPLSTTQVDSMRAAGEHDPMGQYLVVSGRPWSVDATAEWFPIVSGARSVATVQGYEWLGTDVFDDRLAASEELRECAYRGADCLAAWSTDWNMQFTHVYIPKGSLTGALGDDECCAGLRTLLSSDPGYRIAHDGPGATVFERLDG